MGNCPQGQEKQAGLCYEKCREGYSGVGIICQANCPEGLNDIGLFCQRPNYGRGVGTIPIGCLPGQVEQAGLCYEKCREGYSGVGIICQANCPSGFRDDGLICNKPPPYGRGAGYITEQFCKDSNDHGAKENGCEKNGLLWYPRCDPGFHNVGCCICSPNCPPGFGDTGAGCAKPTYTRPVGVIPSACPDGKIYDKGLCYTKCKDGYNGVGPVCWGNRSCPSGWPDTGTGCTKPTYTRETGTVPSISIPWWLWAIPLIIFVLIIVGFIAYLVVSSRKSPPAVVNVTPGQMQSQGYFPARI